MSTQSAHARLAILRFLEDAPQYTSNASILTALLPQVGIALTRDQVLAECQWLKDQELVKVDARRSDFLIVTATVRGVQVALGQSKHPGVARPAPGA